jgi:type I restriction enzyme R subunit
MTTQAEQALEDNLIQQLHGLGYEKVNIKDEKYLVQNLKAQLEKYNRCQLSEKEFTQILLQLNKGNVFEKAKILREKMAYTKDDGNTGYIELINRVHWCQNQFQVTQQVTMEGSYKNRYDVTLLINGLPLVQIELKRRGLELKEAFNQIGRYGKHSYNAGWGLFNYVQLFVISNGVETRYFANNKDQEYKQTFYWSDKDNNRLKQLSEFTDVFLEPCHISKMITKYIVLNETNKVLMVLRPYQYFASEAILERVKNTNKNGYIWHTTGSGKTLTSFKASQLVVNLPEVFKVVFVVDRQDLDYQTSQEYNAFKKGCVSSTLNTQSLVTQFVSPQKENSLIVTTIQKLNIAIKENSRYQAQMDGIRDKKIIFIFDECHRSQFGDTHKAIKNYFSNHQMFGFTGTPIFEKNVSANELGKRTTKDLFDKQLHTYVITDAIRDDNVLKFQVEYVGRFKQKEDSHTNLDINVEDIDSKEALESDMRVEKIVDYIIDHHNVKTHDRQFTAMMCVSGIDMVCKYYQQFQKRKNEGKHDLKIATIFSYAANEVNKDANGIVDNEPREPEEGVPINAHNRDKLEAFMQDYNTMYGTTFNTKDVGLFDSYKKDISQRAKDYEKANFKIKDRVDIILVSDMFLTGFDAKKLSTLYVDKNLKYHGLIQAFSRTNRILGEKKSQGNIVVFRNLKKNADDALELFSDKDAKETIFLAPYESYVEQMEEAIAHLKDIAPDIKSVDQLQTEDEELEFVKAFRDINRVLNVLRSFSDFEFDVLSLEEQEYEDYKSIYYTLNDRAKVNNQKEKVSILNDVDFEMELIHRDIVNVSYILSLLGEIDDKSEEDKAKEKKRIVDMIAGDAELRSKRILIEKFIEENLPAISDKSTIVTEFYAYWDGQKKEAVKTLCEQEGLDANKLDGVLSNYLFTEKVPLNNEVIDMLNKKPRLKERATVIERIKDKLMDFVGVFVDGIEE